MSYYCQVFYYLNMILIKSENLKKRDYFVRKWLNSTRKIIGGLKYVFVVCFEIPQKIGIATVCAFCTNSFINFVQLCAHLSWTSWYYNSRKNPPIHYIFFTIPIVKYLLLKRQQIERLSFFLHINVVG